MGNISAVATASVQPVEYPWTIVDGTKESCVSSAEMLHSSLYDAEADGYNNIIKIVEGAYKGNFIYSGNENFDLILEGGYAPGCATRSYNPELTVPATLMETAQATGGS
jgi:hypothetical protein